MDNVTLSKQLYSSMGIKSSSSKEEIKFAYRKLVKKYHPDNKETGNNSLFIEITKRYETLINSTLSPEPTLDDIFDNKFYGSFRTNLDISVDFFISFNDLFENKQYKYEYLTSMGKKTIYFTIPMGFRPGNSLKFDKMGDDMNPTIERGNLLIRVLLRDRNFTLNENSDVVRFESISYLDALNGSKKIILSPCGKELELIIPENMDYNLFFTFPEMGIFKKQGDSGRTKLIVYPRIVNLTPEKFELYKRNPNKVLD